MGTRGVYGGEEIQTDFEVMALDAIEDIEGDRWVPVLAEDLNNLKARLNNTVEVVHGRWTLADDGDGDVCSVCGTDFCNIIYETGNWNYCPNCGAKMDLED
jgi:hypothetical protein